MTLEGVREYEREAAEATNKKVEGMPAVHDKPTGTIEMKE